jgi:hypothetical protein
MGNSAYEMICEELEAIDAAQQRDRGLTVELMHWLRGDGKMAREGHSTNVHEGRLVNRYLKDEVFTCVVVGGVFQFDARGVRDEAHGLEAAQKIAARLIALAIKREQHERRVRNGEQLYQIEQQLRNDMPAPARTPLKPLYPA